VINNKIKSGDAAFGAFEKMMLHPFFALFLRQNTHRETFNVLFFHKMNRRF
jgi:hypothetical protein